MTQTEWIISLDDDLKDYDELFVGNVRDGDVLIRCKDCVYRDKETKFCRGRGWPMQLVVDEGYCDRAERNEEGKCQ